MLLDVVSIIDVHKSTLTLTWKKKKKHGQILQKIIILISIPSTLHTWALCIGVARFFILGKEKVIRKNLQDTVIRSVDPSSTWPIASLRAQGVSEGGCAP